MTRTWLPVAMSLIVASCLVSETGADVVTTTETRQTTTTTTTDLSNPTTTEAGADPHQVEEYLVEMANSTADLNDRLSEFECDYNEQYWPGSCSGGFTEEGDESEPPPTPSESELFEQNYGLWLGMFDIRLAHADVLDSITPPVGFERAHQAHTDAYRAYIGYVRDRIAGFSSLSDFDEFFNMVFDPLAELPADMESLLLSYVEKCAQLLDLGAKAGYDTSSVDLGCPSAPPEAVSVTVEAGDPWRADTNPLPVGDGLVAMVITNTGTETVRPVVIDIFEGEPLDLPVIDGVVDIARSGVFDSQSPYASFGLAYAGEDEVFIDESGVTGEPPELPPGASVDVVVWSEGTLVVFDYRPGEFEAGARVVITRSG